MVAGTVPRNSDARRVSYPFDTCEKSFVRASSATCAEAVCSENHKGFRRGMRVVMADRGELERARALCNRRLDVEIRRGDGIALTQNLTDERWPHRRRRAFQQVAVRHEDCSCDERGEIVDG